MTIFTLRLFIFIVLPLLFASGLIYLDRSTRTRERRIELVLIYLFSLGVAGSGIGGWFSHLFIADLVAESIGWPTGSPFQTEIGFANLALGILGLIAAGRRDGFREATVIAATVFGFGATIVHIVDIIQTGNLAPGNTLQNLNNLIRPALLIIFLVASRRTTSQTGLEVDVESFEAWRAPRLQAAGILTGVAATGFGIGFAIDQPVIGTLVGILISVIATWVILKRAPVS